MTSTVIRRVLATSVALLGLGIAAVAGAGTAAADTPATWPQEEPVELWHALLLIGGIPVLVFLVFAAITLGPSLARGESLAPSTEEQEDQWLGGPRKAAGELAAPDTEGSQAGGAGGSW